jgi:HK97 family phage major capsid protein
LQVSSQKAVADALKEVDALKTNANKQAETILALQKAQNAFNNDAPGGTPIERFIRNETRCNWLLGCFKKALGMELSPVEKTAVTGVDSGIGQAVTPQETNSMIYDALLTYGAFRTLGQVPIGSRTQIVPLVTARPTAYWVAQGAQVSEGAMTGSSVTLTVKEAIAWLPVARALLDDSQPDMAGYILTQLAQSVAQRLDVACFSADGTNDTTNGAYTGIAVGGTASVAATGNNAVSKLQLEDFMRCLTTVDPAILGRSAKWWIHPQVLAKIVLVRDLNGRPLFQNALDAPNGGGIGSILGYPVVLAAAMPSTDAASKVVAVFGDPDGGAVGIRKSFELARSTDFQFDYNREAFRCIVRAGFVIKSATSFAKLTTAA